MHDAPDSLDGRPSARIGWHLDVVLYRALSEIRAEASRAYIGVLWWIVEPVIYLVTFYLIFTHLFQNTPDDYAAFLLTGLVLWKWISSTIQTGSDVIVSNAGLLYQVRINKLTLIAALQMANFLKFLFIFGVLVVFLVITGHTPSVSWFSLIPLVAVAAVLIAGLSSLLAVMVTFIPETRLLVENGLTATFFLSGIFFDITRTGGLFGQLILYNPIAGLILDFRNILMHDMAPDWQRLGTIAVVASVLSVVGTLSIYKFDARLTKAVL